MCPQQLLPAWLQRLPLDGGIAGYGGNLQAAAGAMAGLVYAGSFSQQLPALTPVGGSSAAIKTIWQASASRAAQGP
jgi:hypothetical protein